VLLIARPSTTRKPQARDLLLAAAATEQLLDLAWYVRDATDCESVVTDASRRGDFPFTYSISSPDPTAPAVLHPCHVSRTRGWRYMQQHQQAVWRALLGTA